MANDIVRYYTPDFLCAVPFSVNTLDEIGDLA